MHIQLNPCHLNNYIYLFNKCVYKIVQEFFYFIMTFSNTIVLTQLYLRFRFYHILYTYKPK